MSSKLTFAVIGLGSIGRRHAGILKELGDHKIVALRSGKSEKQADEFVDKEIFSFEEVEGEKPDGILITNPTSEHMTTAMRAAEIGVPLFIEKPIGMSLDGADILGEILIKKNVPVLMGYNFNFHPAISEMKELISGGAIGKVINARAQFGTYMPEWHRDEDYKKSYASNASMGGGVVLTSIHEQNYLTGMFGEITDIKAMQTGGSILGINAEEGVEIIAKHESGIVSGIHLNFYQRPYYRNCQIIGTEGTLFWDYNFPEINLMYKGRTEKVTLGKDSAELLNKSYADQMKHFIDIIINKTEPSSNFERGIKDLETALRILKEINRN